MTRYVLPDLGYDYAALEPHLSAKIMELHHDKHHRTYVDGANSTVERLIDEARTATASLVSSETLQWLPDVHPHLKFLEV